MTMAQPCDARREASGGCAIVFVWNGKKSVSLQGRPARYVRAFRVIDLARYLRTMSSDCCKYDNGIDREAVREAALAAGAFRCGFAAVGPVDPEAVERYRRWLSEGRHGEMAYLEKYDDVRCDPSLLLEGSRTLISCAFNYTPAVHHPHIADYALGRDYHEVVRELLSDFAAWLRGRYGGETRVCVDTAPLRERYWAVKAGVGYLGLNNYLIVPGAGASFFLGEVLWTGEVEPDEPCRLHCRGCGACVRACPAGALAADGYVDARRCLSYLTIEHRGDLPSGTPLGEHLYGCDVCRLVCPECTGAPVTDIGDFRPSSALMALDRERIANLTQDDFSALFRHSAIRRAKLAGLRRNAAFGNDEP